MSEVPAGDAGIAAVGIVIDRNSYERCQLLTILLRYLIRPFICAVLYLLLLSTYF